MLTLSGMIVANVGTDYINTYLKSKKYAKEDEGKAVEYWVNDLIARERLDIDDFENFLFDELSFGKRKSIRVYKIDNAYEIGKKFEKVSGYLLTKPDYYSSFAGYKDWFIENFKKPGYTIEIGEGEEGRPLSLENANKIYEEIEEIFLVAIEQCQYL